MSCTYKQRAGLRARSKSGHVCKNSCLCILHTLLSLLFRFSQESPDFTPDPATNRDGKQPLSWRVSAPQY